MPLTFGGKPAASVAVRSPHLPLLDPAAESKRDGRRAQDADRLDRHVRAATWRGAQCAYLAERVRRLQPTQERLGRWLDAHDWRTDAHWCKRNKRYWIVATTILAHERVMRGYVDKLHAMLEKKPMKHQEAITAAFFAARNGPPPTKAALRDMGVGR